jgi:hypothetical protein
MSTQKTGTTIALESGIQRSPDWPRIQKEHLRKFPFCACCGKPDKGEMQVHHKFPFHYCIALGRPDLELDERNLVTLCEDGGSPNHHILIGHLGNFESYNPNVDKDIKAYAGWTQTAIKADAKWQAEKDKRPPFLPKMTEAQKTALRKKMDKTFPIG